MTKSEWLDLTVLERRKYNHLSEVMDLSQQMGETLNRRDEVSLRILMAMRQDPIVALEELQRAIALRESALSQEDRARVAALRGGSPPEGPEESAYAAQSGSARRLLERILELDQRLNRRITGDSSFYGKEK